MLRTSVLALFLVLAPPAKSTWVVPSFHDLMIKIRVTRGLSHPMVTAWYFKGPRERNEVVAEGLLYRSPFISASIMQCDLRTQIHLFAPRKTYISYVTPADVGERSPTHHIRPKLPTGPDVNVTLDSVDTGERRPVGGYEASHIKTIITVDPSKGAASQAGKVEIDGWYLDLPGLYCHEDSSRLRGLPIGEWLMLIRGGVHDHLIYKTLGTAPRGLVVEETATQTQGGNVIVNKTELVEVSDQPLDETLFEVPPDYVPRERPENYASQGTTDSNSEQ